MAGEAQNNNQNQSQEERPPSGEKTPVPQQTSPPSPSGEEESQKKKKKKKKKKSSTDSSNEKMDIGQVIKGLRSSNWKKHHKAFEALIHIRDEVDILYLFNQADQKQDNNLKGYILRLMDEILKEEAPGLSSVALYYLFLFVDGESVKIKVESEEVILQFFNDPNLVRYLKIEAIRRCWKMLGVDKRYNLTRYIGMFKLTELVPNLLDNFESNDLKTVKLTITILKLMEDTRGNRYLKKILEGSKIQLHPFTLETLGKLGNFFDGYSLRPFLYSEEPETRKGAVFALVALQGRMIVRKLYRYYFENESYEIKQYVIYRMGKINHAKAVKALLKIWDREKHNETSLKLEWALHEISNKVKVPVMIKHFHRTNDQGKFRIVNYFSDTYDMRCYRLLLKIIEGKYNEFIKVSAMESIALYDRPKAVEILRRFAADNENPMSFYALSALFMHTVINREKLIVDFLNLRMPPNSLKHQLILSVIKGKEDAFNVAEVVNYVHEMMYVDNLNLRFLAISAVKNVYTEEIFKDLVDIYINDPNEHVRDNAHKTVEMILLESPNFISYAPKLLNHPRIIAIFEEKDITQDLAQNIFDLIDDAGLMEYNDFFSTHTKQIRDWAHYFVHNQPDPKTLLVSLEYFTQYDKEIPKNELEFIVDNFYDDGETVIKLAIFKLVAKFGGNAFSEFIIHEGVKRDIFAGQTDHLVSRFINSLS
jgi:HEAT repeat protein